MIEIKNRWSNTVLLRDENATTLLEAVSNAVARDANLRDANLGGANLGGANLRDADLGGIRDDVWAVLDAASGEVPGLLTALREGRIDGTVYSGECACLVGTIANLRGCSTGALPESIQPDSSRPAEQWFLGIRPGDFPAHSQIARITEEWIVEWLGKHGVTAESSIDPGKAVAFARANLEAFQAFGGPRAS